MCKSTHGIQPGCEKYRHAQGIADNAQLFSSIAAIGGGDILVVRNSPRPGPSLSFLIELIYKQRKVQAAFESLPDGMSTRLRA
jgi:hypothetical protein